MIELNINDILDMYDQNESTYTIAEKYGTYPNKIRRLLIKHGRQLNDKSTAQKKALATGRSQHPTEGKQRELEVKHKISEGVYQSWQKISEKERQNRVDKSKEQWYNMTEYERDSLRKAAALAVRKASKEGSKMENFLMTELTALGHDVIFHKTGLIPSENLEVDLFLPALNIAIEIDGPAHFYPIWGEENLQKHIKADAHKSGLLLTKGFIVIRIKHLTKNLSEKHKRDVLEQLLTLLTKISKKTPSKTKRYIEVEVK